MSADPPDQEHRSSTTHDERSEEIAPDVAEEDPAPHEVPGCEAGEGSGRDDAGD